MYVTRRRGVQNTQNCADVIHGWPPNCVIFAHHLHVALATPLLELGLALLKRPLAVESVSHLKRMRWRILSCILKA